jgi:hypothetical protein
MLYAINLSVVNTSLLFKFLLHVNRIVVDTMHAVIEHLKYQNQKSFSVIELIQMGDVVPVIIK